MIRSVGGSKEDILAREKVNFRIFFFFVSLQDDFSSLSRLLTQEWRTDIDTGYATFLFPAHAEEDILVE